MKKLVLTCILIAPILLSAQSNFEGAITYKVITTDEENNFELKIFYGNGKMKAKVFASRPTYESVEIYNFKTGIHYSIFEDEKTYSIDTLDNFSLEDQLSDLRDTTIGESILGYYCRSFTATSKEVNGIVNEISTVMWFPDSIKFIIPEKYRNKGDIETCSDGNMLFLKMLSIVEFRFDDDDENVECKRDTMLMVAHKIEKMRIDELEFQPPADYTFLNEPPFHSRKRDSVVIRELTLTELTQEEDEPEPPPPPPPKNPKPLKAPAKKDKQPKPIKD